MAYKHTTGPWTQHTPNGPNQTALIVRELPSHKRTVVAVIPDHREFGAASVTDANEQDANARLVAAAPDLLAALQNLLRVEALMPRGGEGRVALAVAAEAARAVIAKHGEQK